MSPGDLVAIDFPAHRLHGQRVRIERIEPEFDIAHPDCPERMIVEMIFVRHGSLPEAFGIGPERLAGTSQNAKLREFEAEDGGAQGEMML